ncbi:hypothetical protein MPER_04815 [Moniliophthora perniciosa FA553]|nr:hypothetical protein MPER_04815 [Moniliophthora perniciosa FA553]
MGFGKGDTNRQIVTRYFSSHRSVRPSIENLMDLIGALDVKLTEEEMKYLEAPYEPQAVYGH